MIMQKIKFSENWTKKELKKLIDNEVEENIHLEYKACAAILNEYWITTKSGRMVQKNKATESIKREIAKDVSAFANADGGTIIYGIEERGHKPIALSDGFDPNVISKEWLEQVINSNIQQRIPDIQIHPVDLGNRRFAYVVEIPKSPEAPHMSKDKRYYKRYNFQVLPMEEYEVRELLNRGLYPMLKMQTPKIFVSSDNTLSIVFRVQNIGRVVAKYCDLIIHFDERVNIRLSDEEWKDISGKKPRTKLRWSYERVIHPGLRVTTPEIELFRIPAEIFSITANLYAEKMSMKTFVCEIDVTNMEEPKVIFELKE